MQDHGSQSLACPGGRAAEAAQLSAILWGMALCALTDGSIERAVVGSEPLWAVVAIARPALLPFAPRKPASAGVASEKAGWQPSTPPRVPAAEAQAAIVMVASCHAFGNIGKGIGNAIGGQMHKEIDTSIDATRTGFDATKDVVTTGGISENTRHEFGNTLHDADPTGMDIFYMLGTTSQQMDN